jgi:hypothetical protein
MSAEQARAGARPRPRARVVIDPNNAYSRLGVSPLTPTDEIARILRDRRGALIREARARGEAGDETHEVAELQQIEDEIGNPRARAAYDMLHPQNELLTVQPAAAGAALDPRTRADLITAWLYDELGPDAALPHPGALAFWLPGDDVLAALEPFLDAGEVPPGGATASPRAPDAAVAAASSGLTIEDLADAKGG